MNFGKILLDLDLIKALKVQNITEPTQVQEEVIEKIRENKDLIVQSETGSGKTLAYLLPIFEKYKEMVKTNQVIILVPTHELAIQVQKQVDLLAKNSGYTLRSAVIIGNVNIERQIQKLKEKPQIIIGTSGRIYELIKKKKIAAHTVKTIVIDEADKLLEDYNLKGTLDVIKCTMKDRQLLLFSASINEKTIKTANEILKMPEIIKTNSVITVPKNISHIFIVTERRNKIDVLRKAARVLKSKKAMIFINKVSDIEEATQKLLFNNVKVDCIHGSNLKEDRKKAIEGFKTGKIKYLIATDIAARGLQFEKVDTVFHLSIPKDSSDYLHRAGRTGRNGENGRNVLIVTKEELSILRKYQRDLGIKIVSKMLYEGKIIKGNEVL